MKNRIDAPRYVDNGEQKTLVTEYDDNESLVCETPTDRIVVPPSPDESQIQHLLNKLESKGIHAACCYTCLYFIQPGDFNDLASIGGYCIESKQNKELSEFDGTGVCHSCDAYRFGSKTERSEFYSNWLSADIDDGS